MRRLVAALAVAIIAGASFAGRADAQPVQVSPPVFGAGHGAPRGEAQPGVRVMQRGAPASPVAPHAAEPAHHAEHAAEHEDGPPGDFNLFWGLIGESEDVEQPTLLFRPKGMPAPFAAQFINFIVLVALLIRFGSKPLADALSKRKHDILEQIQEATRLREAAEARLAEYRARLEKIDAEVERVRRESREQAERDRERIVREAEERRARMRREAEFLLQQETKQMHIDLTRDAVVAATRDAAQLVAAQLSAADHERFAQAFIAEVATAKAAQELAS